MSDRRPHPEPRRPRATPEDAVERDLDALRIVTGERLSSLHTQIHTARRGAVRERSFMNGMHSIRRHPWRAGAGVTALAALAFLLIPVSYSSTTGHDVEVRFTAPGLEQGQVATLAGSFRRELHGEHVQIRAEDNGRGPEYVFAAFIPSGNGLDARAVAAGFAGALESSGYRVATQVTPRVEQTSGSVYAMARDQVIRISTDGKSAGQLEAEIRDRLLEAGVPNPEVTVSDEDGMRKVEVRASVLSDDPSAVDHEGVEPSIILTKDGQDLPEGDACQVRVKKSRSDTGETMIVEVEWQGSTGEARVENPSALGDPGLASEIESQLRAAGLDVRVKVEGGKIEVTPNR